MDPIEKMIILGSGTSSNVPVVTCMTEKEFGTEKGCECCFDAYTNPTTSKNIRMNTSMLL